ncbi:MAG: TetR family transcriptional regulator [Gemmatimonas sp.]|nr:TetR family transcriptional regulator [Gemmatimonas sp.]
MSAQSRTARPSKVGRPRKQARRSSQDPKEEILEVSAALFQEFGFTGTTTRQIAAAAGLQQGSLFHYFPRKTEIITTLLDRTLGQALRFSQEKLANFDGPIEAQLCLLTYRDAYAICSSPHNLAALWFLPEVSEGPEFSAYRSKREQLRGVFASYVEAGIEAGVFVREDARVLTNLVFGLVESSIWWFRRGQDEPSVAAMQICTSALRLVLTAPDRADQVAQDALQDARSGGLLDDDPRDDHG